MADEVRRLAEQTASANAEIGSKVGQIYEETGLAVSTMEALRQEVNIGVQRIEQVGRQMDGILQHFHSLEAKIASIAQGAENNHAEVDNISGALHYLREQLQGMETEIGAVSTQAMALSDLGEGLHEALSAMRPSDTAHHRMCQIARRAADEIQQVFEAAVAEGRIADADLFDRNYRPIPNTRPQKYTTRFDQFTDRVLPQIQEPILVADPSIVYAGAVDTNGYFPTHNLKFAQPLTGNYEKDLAGNRTKRIFDDRTGSRCGGHTKKMLLQTYKGQSHVFETAAGYESLVGFKAQ